MTMDFWDFDSSWDLDLYKNDVGFLLGILTEVAIWYSQKMVYGILGFSFSN